MEDKAYNELMHYVRWVVKNYPKVHEEYMLTCHKCGKKFVKESKYIWKPDCRCIKDLRVSIG